MKSWKAWLLVAVIFATGVLAGAFGMRAYMFRNLPEILSHTRKRLDEHILDSIDREMSLSEQQRQAILPILHEAVIRGEQIHQSTRAQFDAIIREADDRIAGELNAEQRVKFAEYRARMERLRKAGPFLPGGPPPGPPEGMPGGPPPGFPPGPPPQ